MQDELSNYLKTAYFLKPSMRNKWLKHIDNGKINDNNAKILMTVLGSLKTAFDKNVAIKMTPEKAEEFKWFSKKMEGKVLNCKEVKSCKEDDDKAENLLNIINE